jgi:tetratricopeptide (TPR) repeat protein
MAQIAGSLLPRERIGNYQILSLVGAGGMGVVYKARDVRLERTVALKFLPQEVGSRESDKQRLLREAKSASALDHTNIGVVHGVEETADGQLFIVMAYYEGETLASRIRRGTLPVPEAVQITAQVARGLAEAHARNIVHRDVKPSNVILTPQSVAKIVDFGIARMVNATSATQSVTILGTAAYMAPEQASGGRVDQRSDIWALGVMLAEMLSGRHPFHRDSVPAVLFAVLNQLPVLEGVPLELQRIIYRALAKDPAHRYQSCGELLADLQALPPEQRGVSGEIAAAATPVAHGSRELAHYIEHAATPQWVPRPRWGWIGAALALAIVMLGLYAFPPTRERIQGALFTSREKHIAVLPFDNLGGDPISEATAAGLMESLSSKLATLEGGGQSLWVVPASVVRRRKVDDPATAWRDLGATLVIKGVIQHEGERVRLTLNLINARRLRQVASLELEDPKGDLENLQEEAVLRLSRLMNVELPPAGVRSHGASPVPAAYDAYLQALGYMQRYDRPGNLELAITSLQSAIRSDPQFALGYAELGEAYRLKYQVELNPKWVEEASANCRKAAQMDAELPVAYVTLGRIHADAGNNDLAVEEFRHALQLDPRSAEAITGMAHALENAGRLPEAEDAYRKAAAMRPDYWDGYNTLALFYDRHGRYEEAITQLERAVALTPDNAQAYFNLGAVLIDTGDRGRFAAAEAALAQSISLAPTYAAYTNLGYLYLQEGRYRESAETTEKALQLNDQEYTAWDNLAMACSWLKQEARARTARNKALTLLQKAARARPRDAGMQAILGRLYAQEKMKPEAQAHMQAALALAPDDAQVLADVGEAYESLGERGLALATFYKALQKGASLNDLQHHADLQSLLSDPNFRPIQKQ